MNSTDGSDIVLSSIKQRSR